VVRRPRELVAPLYLLLCLILGGSAQGIWNNMLLQLVGIAIIAWAAVAAPDQPLARPARQLLILFALAIAVVLVQLIPLAPSVWEGLGGRRWITADYALLGLQPPNLPISLTPYKSLAALLGVIPPLAMICAMVRLKAYRASLLAAALVVGTIAGVLLGAVQVGTTGQDASPWYLYPETNVGLGVGFFANANHMADLLVITLPFLAALLAAGRRVNIQRLSALVAVVIGAGLVIVIGIFTNQSLAAYGLAPPVLLASLLIILPPRSRARPWVMAAAAVLLVGATGLLARSAVGGLKLNQDASTSVESRQAILATTSHALKDYMPFGSGLGSFRQVYDRYEDLGQVTPTFVVHAHNDYAELALETGVAGIIVTLLFLAWWAAAVWRVWTSPEEGPFARAASIASAAILAHSFVDFPLRTAAISACFGMCMALLADRRAAPPADASDLRPTRHFVLR
jgi:O-antigen ligase